MSFKNGLNTIKYTISIFLPQLIVASSAFAASGAHSGDPTFADLKYYIINFLIYLAFVAFLISKFAPKGWASRRQRIQESLEASIAKVSAAERSYQAAKQRIENLDEDVRNISEQMKVEAEREAQEIIVAAKNQSLRIVKQAQDNAEAERKVSESAIRKEYAARALKLAEEKLRKEITPERDRTLRTAFQDSVKELIH